MLTKTVASLVLLASSFLATGVSGEGGYLATCNNANLQVIPGDGVYLDASCGNGHGGYTSTSLKLGLCFGNNNGRLVFQRK